MISDDGDRVWRLISASARDRGEPMSAWDVCAVCARGLPAGGAGVSLLAGDRLEPTHAFGALGRGLLDASMVSGDGPCVEAVRTGVPVLAADLDGRAAGGRWPLFSALAQAARVAAVFAFPLVSGRSRVGVLTACRDRPGGLGAAGYRDGLLLADAAVALLLREQEEAAADPAAPADWLALGAEIHQAAGMVSVQLDCTVEDALARLRAHAFANDLTVSRAALLVVERALRFSPDRRPGGP
ncbi:GAF domain-containing protein [Actinomadura parmotrematis]|uniref:GAF domain-containing protein n=1 Tax=Actinomadura parmotrematis TaxID=2864039 RepID=A0ABS7FKD0_9ACTN|nr:GAF domain-containing protein [Actinomadura parmotrematis]MBW8480815.1 GAF domain-containing protein [Actinomadura parmotrematis]